MSLILLLASYFVEWIPNGATNSIVGGSPATAGEFPWQL